MSLDSPRIRRSPSSSGLVSSPEDSRVFADDQALQQPFNVLFRKVRRDRVIHVVHAQGGLALSETDGSGRLRAKPSPQLRQGALGGTRQPPAWPPPAPGRPGLPVASGPPASFRTSVTLSSCLAVLHHDVDRGVARRTGCRWQRPGGNPPTRQRGRSSPPRAILRVRLRPGAWPLRSRNRWDRVAPRTRRPGPPATRKGPPRLRPSPGCPKAPRPGSMGGNGRSGVAHPESPSAAELLSRVCAVSGGRGISDWLFHCGAVLGLADWSASQHLRHRCTCLSMLRRFFASSSPARYARIHSCCECMP